MGKWRKKEIEHASLLQSYPYPRSGAGMTADDASNGFFHIQLKITSLPFYKLHVKTLRKLKLHATLHGEIPLLAVFFEGSNVYVLLSPIINSEGEGKVVQRSVRIAPHKYDSIVVGDNGERWGVATVLKDEVQSFLNGLKATYLGVVEGE